MSFPAYSNL